LFFFFCVFSSIGISTFAGALTHRCEDAFLRRFLVSDYNGTCLDGTAGDCSVAEFFAGPDRVPTYQGLMFDNDVQLVKCPNHVADECGLCGGHGHGPDGVLFARGGRRNEKCCRVLDAKSVHTYGVAYGHKLYSDRRDEIEYVGFDNALTATLTEFIATTMDEWPALAHPITNSDSNTAFLAWPFFASMTLLLGILTANLFVSVICYAFSQLDLEKYKKAKDESHRGQLRAMFDRFDDDGSGSIAEAELIDMADLLGIKMSPSEAKAAIHLLDDDNTKSIDFEEFAHWWDSSEELALRMKRALASEQHRLKHAFDSVDIDRGGIINREEVEAMGQSLGIDLTAEETAQMMMELDNDGNEEVSLDEFARWWFAGSNMAQKIKAFTSGEGGRIRNFFDQCADAKTKRVTFESVKALGKSLGFRFSPPEIARAFSEMDEEGTGRFNVRASLKSMVRNIT